MDRRVLRVSLSLVLVLAARVALGEPAAGLAVSGRMNLKVPPGTHVVPVGNGEGWRLVVGSRASASTDVQLRASLKAGRPRLGSAQVTLHTGGIVLANPGTAAGDLHVPGCNVPLVRGLVNTVTDFKPSEITLSRQEPAPGAAGEIRCGVKGEVQVALGLAGTALDRTSTLPEDGVRSWVKQLRARGRSGPASSGALTLVPEPERRLLTAGKLEGEVELRGTAQLCAGQHRLPVGKASACSVEIARSSTASVALHVSGDTQAPAQAAGSASIRFEPALVVHNPLEGLGTMSSTAPGGRLRGLRQMAARVADRMLTLSVDEVAVEKGASGAPKVSARGRALLFGKIGIRFSRSLQLPTPQNSLAAGLDGALGLLKQSISAFDGELGATLRPAGSTGTALSVKAQPSLRTDVEGMSLRMPVQVSSPNLTGSFTATATQPVP